MSNPIWLPVTVYTRRERDDGRLVWCRCDQCGVEIEDSWIDGLDKKNVWIAKARSYSNRSAAAPLSAATLLNITNKAFQVT